MRSAPGGFKGGAWPPWRDGKDAAATHGSKSAMLGAQPSMRRIALRPERPRARHETTSLEAKRLPKKMQRCSEYLTSLVAIVRPAIAKQRNGKFLLHRYNEPWSRGPKNKWMLPWAA